jgi:hypothetical protein
MFCSNKYRITFELNYFFFLGSVGDKSIKTGQRYHQNNAVTSQEAIMLAHVTQSDNE